MGTYKEKLIKPRESDSMQTGEPRLRDALNHVWRGLPIKMRELFCCFSCLVVFFSGVMPNKYCAGFRRDWSGAEIIAKRLLYTHNRGFHVYRCLQAQAAFQGIFFGEESGSRFSGFLCSCHCPRRLFHLLSYRDKRVATRLDDKLDV